jgi:uncharacterized membrane protein
MRTIVALSVSALLLTACGQDEAPGGMDAPPPADAPASVVPPLKDGLVSLDAKGVGEFAVDFGLRGTEPFWGLNIAGDRLTLTRPEPPAVEATSRSFVATERQAVWTGETADGRTIVATLTKGDCSDGMSDLDYPYVAEVRLGGETLKGCGFRTDAQPREGG